MMLFYVVVIAICGILYELLIGTLSSYLIGNSVQQFSFVIGFFLSGMGIGAYLSRYVQDNALKNFFIIELILSFVGASSVIFLKFSYMYLFHYPFFYQVAFFFLTMLIGALVGMEIPLVAEIYKKLKFNTKTIVSDIFTFDYIGGLIASLLFPLVLLPLLGLYNIAIFVGSINLIVAISYYFFLKKNNITVLKGGKYIIAIILIIVYFAILLFSGTKLENIYMQFYYKEPILESYQSPYQEIVLTKRGEDFRMYLNGNLQFLSLDEGMYHEALVDFPMRLLNNNTDLSVLVMGAGDGLAVRNLLAYENINDITLVELDPKVLEIATSEKNMLALNNNSLSDPRVEVITQDAFNYIMTTEKKYDLIIADFPDPRDVGISKLYAKEFYAGVFTSLSKDGIFITQASNAFFSNKVLFTVEKTLKDVFGNAVAYHRFVPSFGDWGYVIASKTGDIDTNKLCPESACSYFYDEYLEGSDEIVINTLANPKIIEYYLEGYKKFNM